MQSKLDNHRERLELAKAWVIHHKSELASQELKVACIEETIKTLEDLIAKGGRFEHKTGQSSVIKSFEYAFGNVYSTLSVEFNDGSVYHYGGVTRRIYEGMRDAHSVGSYFVREVKGRYHYEKEGL